MRCEIFSERCLEFITKWNGNLPVVQSAFHGPPATFMWRSGVEENYPPLVFGVKFRLFQLAANFWRKI